MKRSRREAVTGKVGITRNLKQRALNGDAARVVVCHFVDVRADRLGDQLIVAAGLEQMLEFGRIFNLGSSHIA